jgi:hypothetical protein
MTLPQEEEAAVPTLPCSPARHGVRGAACARDEAPMPAACQVAADVQMESDRIEDSGRDASAVNSSADHAEVGAALHVADAVHSEHADQHVHLSDHDAGDADTQRACSSDAGPSAVAYDAQAPVSTGMQAAECQTPPRARQPAMHSAAAIAAMQCPTPTRAVLVMTSVRNCSSKQAMCPQHLCFMLRCMSMII